MDIPNNENPLPFLPQLPEGNNKFSVYLRENQGIEFSI